MKTDIDDANRKLEDAKNADTTLPEVTLPIDDALFASCKQILAAWDPQYNANELPANLAEAKGSTAKMGAMVNAIERATQNINSTAAAENLLESGMDVAQSAAYLDAQYTALTGRIQALDAEIAGLEDDKAPPRATRPSSRRFRRKSTPSAPSRRATRKFWTTMPPAAPA